MEGVVEHRFFEVEHTVDVRDSVAAEGIGVAAEAVQDHLAASVLDNIHLEEDIHNHSVAAAQVEGALKGLMMRTTEE